MSYQNPVYRLPFDGRQRISSPYGMRTLNGITKLHKGTDFVAEGDAGIHPVVGGVVQSSTIVTDKSNATWQWGNYVKVKGDDGLFWFYCHMASRAVKVGQRVEQADVLGVMGSTGYSTGPHTHVECRDASGKSLDTGAVLGFANAKQALEYSAEKAAEQMPAQKPDNPRDTADWNAESNDFIVSASKGDRAKLRDACAQIQLPVRNA